MSDQIHVDPQFVINAQQNRIAELSQQLVMVEAFANQQQAVIASQQQQIEQLLSAMPDDPAQEKDRPARLIASGQVIDVEVKELERLRNERLAEDAA